MKNQQPQKLIEFLKKVLDQKGDLCGQMGQKVLTKNRLGFKVLDRPGVLAALSSY